ncbi:hypothetical protein L596_009821 [Steinernema carpocapsae]|uniref:Dehydrogenase/reductase SDR family member 1 n=1 Tax=Steinernema carpocapsae TaxID=34508 RepID=A0A4U5PGF8_STECR|nr:hypothetical protein L596_009821 [Steinernema carpocapsae]
MVANKPLSGKVALVTGGSRGIGRGVALQLGENGATVYVTARPTDKQEEFTKNLGISNLEKTAEQVTKRGGKGIAVYCDHSDPEDVKKLFERIEKEQNGRLDILVNSAFAGHTEVCLHSGKFWERDPSLFAINNDVGLTGSYICATYACRLMVPKKKGLIVTLSSVGGANYIFTPAYGVGNAACDRLAADMAHELVGTNVVTVAIWPGAVNTEYMKYCVEQNPELKSIFETAESQEFLGKCVVAMATDPKITDKSGHIVTTMHLAKEYGLVDENGEQPKDALIEQQEEHINFFNSTKPPKTA